MPDRPDPATQVNAIAADFAARLAPTVREACKGVAALGAELAKQLPSMEKFTGEALRAFAVAALPPARKDADA